MDEAGVDEELNLTIFRKLTGCGKISLSYLRRRVQPLLNLDGITRLDDFLVELGCKREELPEGLHNDEPKLNSHVILFNLVLIKVLESLAQEKIERKSGSKKSKKPQEKDLSKINDTLRAEVERLTDLVKRLVQDKRKNSGKSEDESIDANSEESSESTSSSRSVEKRKGSRSDKGVIPKGTIKKRAKTKIMTWKNFLLIIKATLKAKRRLKDLRVVTIALIKRTCLRKNKKIKGGILKIKETPRKPWAGMKAQVEMWSPGVNQTDARQRRSQ